MDVVIVGSFMTDLMSYCTDFPEPGETVHGHKFKKSFGGKGANQCIMAQRLGGKTAMIGRVGDDGYGIEHLEHFKKHSVNVDHIYKTEKEQTGVANIIVNDKGQNCIVIVSAANLKLNENDLKAAEVVIKSAKVLVTQMEILPTTALAALKIAKKHGVKTILNVAPVPKALPDEIYKLVDYFCVNELEAASLWGNPVNSIEDANKSAKEFIHRGCSNVILTLGKMGSVFVTEAGINPIHIPAQEVKAVDSTGAGDAFVGSLAFYLATRPDLPVQEIIRRSNDIATASVLKPGTQDSYPYKKDLSHELFA
ncbi:rbsK [Acanthosepion pharaonis]|uniref:Ribokinase n=1 Tax=Acanthosepion pharaonis TaxID=158019 RepID=A0A812EQC7_ACAPH|nr:rbsK [Sepia pharaonis]